jgi:hypothetical protein
VIVIYKFFLPASSRFTKALQDLVAVIPGALLDVLSQVWVAEVEMVLEHHSDSIEACFGQLVDEGL